MDTHIKVARRMNRWAGGGGGGGALCVNDWMRECIYVEVQGCARHECGCMWVCMCVFRCVVVVEMKVGIVYSMAPH